MQKPSGKHRLLHRLAAGIMAVFLVVGGIYSVPGISRAEGNQEITSESTGMGMKTWAETERDSNNQSELVTETKLTKEEGLETEKPEIPLESENPKGEDPIETEALTEPNSSGDPDPSTDSKTSTDTKVPSDKKDSTKAQASTDLNEAPEISSEADIQNRSMSMAAGANDLAIQGVIDKVYTELKDPNQQNIWLEKSDTINWNDTNTAAKWDGTIASEKTGDEISNPNFQIVPVDGVWQVYSPQQLAWALQNVLKGETIRLMADMDLSGDQYNWVNAKKYTNVIFDGQYHTIYNLGAYETSFLGDLDGCVLKDFVFDSAKVVSEKLNAFGIGIISGNNASGGVTNIKNVTVRNSLFASGRSKAPIGLDAYVSPMGYSQHMNIENLYTDNNVLASLFDHVGGVVGRPNFSSIKNSFSVNSTVIAGGDHSGGFVSCVDDGLIMSDCFTNNDVYGNATTGVFIGAIWPATSGSSFKRCYASGTIEGKTSIGGFAGCIQTGPGSLKITFEDCYSTSIVGMQVGGSRMGGFIGDLTGATDTVSFNNCYVAGEVGHVDTVLDLGQVSNPNAVGGFVGVDKANKTTYVNCYYDKQTTAMRERGIGNAASRNGIKGVLTAESIKSGAGLAGKPGLTGFIEFSNANWIYDGRSAEDHEKHNCLYPQLFVFESPNSGSWNYGENGESYDDLVQAYSLASVSTVHQQVWDYGADENALPETTYDTVRDITQRFTLTSYAIPGNGSSVEIQWKKGRLVNGSYQEATSNLYGTGAVPVIGFLGRTYNGTYDRDYMTADKFAPGIEWVTVNVTINKNAIGTRKIRIVPTSNLIPGNDNTSLTSGSKYNHTLDYRMGYSTANRMSANMNDITTSPYPGSTDQYKDIDLSIIPGLSGAGSSLSVTMYKVNQITMQTGSTEGKIDFNKNDLLADTSAEGEIWKGKLNGTKAFEEGDQGRYIIEYTWKLSDQRFIRDSKMIVIRMQKHQVDIQVEDKAGNPLSDQMKLKIAEFTDNSDVPELDIPEESPYIQSVSEKVSDGKHAALISRKKDAGCTINEIQLTLNTIDGQQYKTVSDIDNTGTSAFEFPVVYYYGSYEQGGNYYVLSQIVTKSYVFQYHEDTGCYALLLNSESTVGGVLKYDVDSDIQLVIRLDMKEKYGSLELKKITLDENGSEQYFHDKFIFKLTGIDDPSFQTSIMLSSDPGKNEKILNLPVGRYFIEELIPMQYEFQEAEVENGLAVPVNKTEILIEDAQKLGVYYRNKKINSTGGTGGTTNVLSGNTGTVS